MLHSSPKAVKNCRIYLFHKLGLVLFIVYEDIIVFHRFSFVTNMVK